MPQVVAIDLDPTSVDLARRQDDDMHVDYLEGDFLSYPFEPGSFDVVCAVAAVHHMDAEVALSRMREVLRPGGTLAIVGLARTDLPADLPVALASIVATQIYKVLMSGSMVRPSAPERYRSPTVWPPPQSYSAMRDLAARTLPGVRYRRHLLHRYSLVWTKPHP